MMADFAGLVLRRRCFGITVHTDCPESGIFQLFYCTGEVGHSCDGQVFNHSRGCFGMAPVSAGAFLFLHNQGQGIKGDGGTNNGSDVLGIGYLIEN